MTSENNDRCPICGAKHATHDQNHSCRMHTDPQTRKCTVCHHPYKFCVRYYTKRLCVGMLPGPDGCAVECPGNDHF